MLDFILRYYLQIMLTLLTGAVSYGFKKIARDLKKDMSDKQAIKDAMRVILHDIIIDVCNQHIKNGYISIDSLEDLEQKYKPYVALGGNGAVKTAFEHAKRLKIQ